MEFFSLYILSGIVIACFCSVVAGAKGYSGLAWGLGGFFFNIIALIAIAGMPVKKQ